MRPSGERISYRVSEKGNVVMASFEFFKTDYRIYGKHARMAGELCLLNDYEHTYFKRLVDIIPAAAVIGFRLNRKAEPDYSPIETKTVFLQQMLGAKEELDFLLQTMIMLESAERMNAEEAVHAAFRGAQTKEEFDRYQGMFDAYVRGGIEQLYECLVIRRADSDDAFYENKTANLMALFARFAPKTT